MLSVTDKAIFLWLNALTGRVPLLDTLITWLASDYLVPVNFGFILLSLWFVGGNGAQRMRYQISVFTALTSMALANLAVLIINAIYSRPRPFDGLDGTTTLFYYPEDPSFPSNAAAATFAIAISVWCVNRRLGAVMFIAAASYGFARMYVGVHYITDILGGLVVAFVATALTLRLRDLLRPVLVAVIKAARLLAIA